MTKSPHQTRRIPGSFLLDWIERIGNRLPDPIILFALLCVVTIVGSAIAAGLNWTETNPASEETISAVSLLSAEMVRQIFTKAVDNFVEFPPLGTVLVAMLGVGVAEQVGLLGAIIRRVVLAAPARYLTPIVILAGVLSNIATDAGYVVLVPIGALMFLAFGRHPLVGLAAAYAGVSGGFSANLVINILDPLLAGITQRAAQLIEADYTVNATANYYFMAVSTLIVVVTCWMVTDWIIEPRFGSYQGDQEFSLDSVNESERRGLRWAGYSLLAFVGLILVLTVPPNGILRNPETGGLVPSPLLEGIVFLITITFFIPAVAYGYVVGKIQNSRDIAKAMADSMSGMGYYIALAFVAAQFLAYFDWSNLGTLAAIALANGLEAINLTGIPLVIASIVAVGLINLLIGSASAQWSVLAPVLVPMFMLLGYTPEFAQAVFRVGDSITNIVTPLMPYLPVILAFGQRYDSQMSLGTLIATMVPYAIALFISWSGLLALWMILNWQLGPAAPISLS